jgi:hypothetical protein
MNREENPTGQEIRLFLKKATKRQNVPQMERPTFDEFLKLDRHLSAFVDVQSNKTRGDDARLRQMGGFVAFTEIVRVSENRHQIALAKFQTA